MKYHMKIFFYPHNYKEKINSHSGIQKFQNQLHT